MLLEKFEFIPPDNLSGYLPLEGSVKVIKKNQYRYVNLGTIIGDAPKCMVALYDFEKDFRDPIADGDTRLFHSRKERGFPDE